MKQLQNLATPIVWFVRRQTQPQESMSVQSGAPAESWADVTPVNQSVTETGLLSLTASPTATNGDSFIHAPDQSEALKTQASAPAATNDTVFFIAANQSEALKTQASAPTATNDTVFFNAPNQNESMAARSGQPIATNG